MMMRALYEGGIPAIFQPEQEKFNREVDGYAPNPGSLMEVGQQYYMNAHFLRNIPDDSVIKILYDGLPNLPVGQYTIVFMERDEAEINASLAKSDAHLRARGIKENPPKPFTFDSFRPYRRGDIDHVLGICESRKDFDLVRVDYRDVIADPEAVFNRLKYTPLGRERLNIDVAKAVATIQPEYYRERKDAHNEGRSNGLCAQGSGDRQSAA